MKVKCASLGGEALLAADIDAGNTQSSVFHVTLDQDYTVYGVFTRGPLLSYLIQADTGLPQWTPAALFQVVCGRVSRHWVFADWSSTEYVAAMTFAEFVETPEAFDQLVEGEDSAREIFFRRKESADLEFMDPAVTKAAALEGKWVQCPLCSDAWECESLDAMVRCPTCQSVLRSPMCPTE